MIRIPYTSRLTPMNQTDQINQIDQTDEICQMWRPDPLTLFSHTILSLLILGAYSPFTTLS